MSNYLSPYLCNFKHRYSNQYSLNSMLDKWGKALDKKDIVAALTTDLSKAFDCLNHELLVAKMEAYGFGHDSLRLVLSYLTNGKQRTMVNYSFKLQTFYQESRRGRFLDLYYLIYISTTYFYSSPRVTY